MFKLRYFTLLSIKWAHFKFDACYRTQNSWDGGMFTMVKHILFFSKQFEDVWASRSWVSGVLVLEFGPIFAWYRFPAAEEFVVTFDIFLCFNDAPNVLYRWKIWGLIYKMCVRTDFIVECAYAKIHGNVPIYKDTEKSLAPHQGLSWSMHVCLPECCRLLEI